MSRYVTRAKARELACPVGVCLESHRDCAIRRMTETRQTMKALKVPDAAGETAARAINNRTMGVQS